MATKAANLLPANGMHTAGIYSDMTVDGPEIGTLVVVFDRAKNLPNRKTMGKQDPYCAARLGKEAKKTETDVRGGQTPRWDQEVRFTVHDSPDYNNIKVSVFNDDKKTDLIGETWINLEKVIVPGGGQNDTWHNLNYRGKYAGEIRIEMSYYDSRPPVEKPERQRESLSGGFDGRSSVGGPRNTPVKRRPLPSGPGSSNASPAIAPGRQSFGPREPGTRTRGTSITPGHASPLYHGHPQGYISPVPVQEQPYDDSQGRDGGYASQQNDDFAMPDFLPQLPPKNRSRTSLPQSPRGLPIPYTPPVRPQTHIHLQHSHSAPNVPTAEDFEYDGDQYHPGLAHAGAPTLYNDPYHSTPPMHRHSIQGPPRSQSRELPPPPPSHSNGTSPYQPRMRGSTSQNFISSTSPLQSIETDYGASPRSHAHPARSQSGDDYLGSSPSYGRSPMRNQHASTRHSISDPYVASNSPRTHPLAQEMQRSASPQPYYGNEDHPEYDEPREYYSREASPIYKPRAVSPQPSRPSVSAIRHPISSYEVASTAASPSAVVRTQQNHTVVRKSVSPRASLQDTNAARAGGMPFSPDSFDSFNPSASGSSLERNANPHSPFHVPTPPKSAQGAPVGTSQSGPGRPGEKIVGWDGRVIDPSDHLPVEAWAPEPEVKTPTKTYGAGGTGVRGGLAGPRTSQLGISTGGGPRLHGNVVVNVRNKGRAAAAEEVGGARGVSPGRSGPGSRLMKNSRSPPKSPVTSPMGTNPLREIDVPNPYAQQTRFSPRFGGTDGGFGDGNSFDGRGAGYNDGTQPQQNRGYGSPYDQFGGNYQNEEYYDEYDRYGNGNGQQEYGLPAPPKPPKVPIGQSDEAYQGYGSSALSREMARIDIGGGSSRRGGGSSGGRGGVPPQPQPQSQPPTRRARFG